MRSDFVPNIFALTILLSNTEVPSVIRSDVIEHNGIIMESKANTSMEQVTFPFSNDHRKSLLVWGAMASAVGKLNSLAENETFPSLPMESPALSQLPLEPYFDLVSPGNVTALVGKSAYLTCRVRNLGDKTVSWIRHRDIHILTVGSYTYTSDQRFQSNHHPETDDWVLQIKWAQKRDAGMYECQISTQPVLSYFVNLNVVVPTAQILGGSDIHVDKGSTINLTCSIRFSPEPPAYIFWYHHDEVISYDSSRGGVSVITEKGDVTTSFLIIQHADIADSGKYSCSPSNADVASVKVHVLNGATTSIFMTPAPMEIFPIFLFL